MDKMFLILSSTTRYDSNFQILTASWEESVAMSLVYVLISSYFFPF